MKQAKAPTRQQKILISSYRLQPGNWLVALDTKEEIIIKHRHTGSVRTLPKDRL